MFQAGLKIFSQNFTGICRLLTSFWVFILIPNGDIIFLPLNFTCAQYYNKAIVITFLNSSISQVCTPHTYCIRKNCRCCLTRCLICLYKSCDICRIFTQHIQSPFERLINFYHLPGVRTSFLNFNSVSSRSAILWVIFQVQGITKIIIYSTSYHQN